MHSSFVHARELVERENCFCEMDQIRSVTEVIGLVPLVMGLAAGVEFVPRAGLMGEELDVGLVALFL